MKFTPTSIPDVLLIEVETNNDSRGSFFEAYNRELFEKNGIRVPFVQDNQSRSARGVLRGLHYQLAPKAQAKLVRVVKGSIFDVAVDMRRNSKTFGRHVTTVLSAENRQMMFIPAGFAHGFCAMENDSDVIYKVSEFYAPGLDRGVRWDDPELGIAWPKLDIPYQLSAKDQKHPSFAEAVAESAVS